MTWNLPTGIHYLVGLPSCHSDFRGVYRISREEVYLN